MRVHSDSVVDILSLSNQNFLEVNGSQESEKMQNKEKTEMEIKAQEAAQNDTQMLYEASMRGCVATLNTLIQNDPFILHKISLSAFTETPLHISALLGHVEFTKAIVSQKPQLVTELDSFKRSPLHLAAAVGHREIVKELLLANKDVGLVADQEGRIPLHLAAMRGRVEVIQELIGAKPESILVQIHGETVLHLCVRYNHLDALKVLVASVEDEEFLNSQNHEGNTILQVSAILQQYQTSSYLLSVPKIRVDANSLIKNGFAAFDGSCRNGTTESNLQKNPITETVTKAQTTQSPQKSNPKTSFFKWRKFMKYKSDHHETTRGNMMVVATIIATMSFQIATNPPGGYWQADTTNQKDQTCPKGVICRAGTSIHAYTHETEYHNLIILSTFSFSVSLSVILWLISGVPLRNRVSVGILLLGVWTTVLLVAAAYYCSISLVMPHDEIFDAITQWYQRFWPLFLVAVIFIHTFRFCWWVVKKLFMGVIYVAKCCCCKNNKQQPDQLLMVSV